MSGIAGILFHHARPVNSVDLIRMIKAIAHRGPDDEGHWTEGCIGLAHRMLWTTPESLFEKLPHIHNSGRYVITADTRIDNRDHLINILGLNDCGKRVITDCQIALAAYIKWGLNCLDRLIGDYAFAIWDKKESLLFCARDHIGVKPFYYYHSDKLFCFSSEIKSIFCLPEIPRKLNELKIAYHIATYFEDKSITHYKDIFRLPPAHYLIVKDGRKKLGSYWSLDPEYEIRYNSDKEYAEAFREIFVTAVKDRLRSAYPIGSTLSGGLDSSSIACVSRNLLKEQGQERLHTFSAIFPSLPKTDLRKIDERSFIEKVLSTGGFSPHFIEADRLSPLSDLEKLTRTADEAVLAPNLYIHHALYKTASENGVRIFLDGIDGDTTVSHGLELLPELISKGNVNSLIKEAKGIANKSKFSYQKIILIYGIKPLLPNMALKLFNRLLKNNDTSPDYDMVINPKFRKSIGLDQHITYEVKKTSLFFSAKEAHLSSLNSGLNTHALQQLDNAAVSFCIEPRYPFFDRRLQEFCLAIPPHIKLKNGWGRYIMRRAMEDILPYEIQWRPLKANLSPNLTRKLAEYEKNTLNDIIYKDNVQMFPYYNIAYLGKIFDRYTKNPIHFPKEAIILYGAATLSEFLKSQKNL